jgi:long-subunit fatty acid transport protein
MMRIEILLQRTLWSWETTLKCTPANMNVLAIYIATTKPADRTAHVTATVPTFMLANLFLTVPLHNRPTCGIEMSYPQEDTTLVS